MRLERSASADIPYSFCQNYQTSLTDSSCFIAKEVTWDLAWKSIDGTLLNPFTFVFAFLERSHDLGAE